MIQNIEVQTDPLVLQQAIVVEDFARAVTDYTKLVENNYSRLLVMEEYREVADKMIATAQRLQASTHELVAANSKIVVKGTPKQ